MSTRNVVLPLIAVGLQVRAAAFLSQAAAHVTPKHSALTHEHTGLLGKTFITGILSGVYTLALPYLLEIEDPIVLCVVRIICFFYGCKILDVAVARLGKPPKLVGKDGKQIQWSTSTYVWKVLTETRYKSFNLAVKQEERENISGLWNILGLVVVPALVKFFPSPETKSLGVLLLIQVSLEVVHFVLKPWAPSFLFWSPFGADSLTSFWRTHWHGGAYPFVRSLAYNPGYSIAFERTRSESLAKAAGVVSAFSFTGIWHAWACAALATDPWMVALRVWSLFVGMGLGVALEAKMPQGLKGSLPHRIFVWVFFTFWAGWAWRGLQSNCKVQWLADL